MADMRVPLLPVAFLILVPLAGCMTGRSDGSPKVQTSPEANRENIQGAVAAPLRDLNVLRTKIPSVLLEAMADPYARPADTRCPTLNRLLTPLNQALGADLDIAPTDEDDVLERGREAGLGAVANVASGAIPFRGWVRSLSGAEQHDKLVTAAITAGAVRRGYLKGLGESKGCPPPATPSHELAGRPALEINDPLKPRYPIRAPNAVTGNDFGTRPAAPPR
jgi:hypothetical protein